jgi:hypothetical protein
MATNATPHAQAPCDSAMCSTGFWDQSSGCDWREKNVTPRTGGRIGSVYEERCAKSEADRESKESFGEPSLSMCARLAHEMMEVIDVIAVCSTQKSIWD